MLCRDLVDARGKRQAHKTWSGLIKRKNKGFKLALDQVNICGRLHIYLTQIWYLIFMSSRTGVASAVSCKLGNKNGFFLWIFICLLPKFLGTSVVYVNFLLITAIDRSPSALSPFKCFDKIHV
ncbi:hypothetical protein Ancab_031382 [Ancistrocladus abbreviatus]